MVASITLRHTESFARMVPNLGTAGHMGETLSRLDRCDTLFIRGANDVQDELSRGRGVARNFGDCDSG